ncbi:unnamed protein product [Diabrotica balteata]|uniref:Uncharacterized protein n=1 Tax=Diabrotica balteata TaxID=107213 RepID=A0A9N9TE50_DIABA|nr:unnamed protein product [Diabrotica balteata]
MYDILEEFSMLSEALQNRDTTVVYADKLIRRRIGFFKTLKEKPENKSLEAYIVEKGGNFNNVPITKMSAKNCDHQPQTTDNKCNKQLN